MTWKKIQLQIFELLRSTMTIIIPIWNDLRFINLFHLSLSYRWISFLNDHSNECWKLIAKYFVWENKKPTFKLKIYNKLSLFCLKKSRYSCNFYCPFWVNWKLTMSRYQCNVAFGMIKISFFYTRNKFYITNMRVSLDGYQSEYYPLYKPNPKRYKTK